MACDSIRFLYVSLHFTSFDSISTVFDTFARFSLLRAFRPSRKASTSRHIVRTALMPATHRRRHNTDIRHRTNVGTGRTAALHRRRRCTDVGMAPASAQHRRHRRQHQSGEGGRCRQAPRKRGQAQKGSKRRKGLSELGMLIVCGGRYSRYFKNDYISLLRRRGPPTSGTADVGDPRRRGVEI